MFRLDMDAIRKSAADRRLMANSANLANWEQNSGDELPLSHSLAKLATLAISHASDTNVTSLLTARLLVAAMNVCDQHGDSELARAEMREQCLALSPHLQADLLEHFQGKRPSWVHLRPDPTLQASDT